jgi:hypothetical protein
MDRLKQRRAHIAVLIVVALVVAFWFLQPFGYDGATTALNFLDVAAAGLLYAGVDYSGFNATKHRPSLLKKYRIFQLIMQSALTVFLALRCGLAEAVAFNLVWWTFGLDFLYYVYAFLLNPGRPWDSRGDLRKWVFQNDARWAYWTPIGIARGMSKDVGISGKALTVQSTIGILAAAGIILIW